MRLERRRIHPPDRGGDEWGKPMIPAHGDGFRFGLEAEYLLADAETFRPLWHRDLTFAELDALLASIPVDDLPPVDGLLPLPPHRTRMPYVVEGYHLPDPYTDDARMIPKGVEIRTPVCGSIEEAVAVLGELHGRLQRALADRGQCAVALSHHPLEDHFEGPQGGRRFDTWRWAQEAMLTYGPDVNISLPPRQAARLDVADLAAKVNSYAPALTALSLASPLHRGGPWMIRGRVGKSLRTHRRSVVGQALELHPEQSGRLEFKSFEMTHRLGDFHGYLLLWLALLLDEGLKGRASDQSRVYDLGAVARDGLEVDTARDRAAEVLGRAPTVLASWDFDPHPLEPFARRLETRRLPADEILALYEHQRSIPAVLRHLAPLIPSDLIAAGRRQ
jgi:Glutamate-cysteine ligase family 2(GCS2)